MILSLLFHATLEFEEAKTFKPWIIFPNENNNFNLITISSKINVILTLQKTIDIIPIVFFILNNTKLH
jgi:hypothetical protein